VWQAKVTPYLRNDDAGLRCFKDAEYRNEYFEKGVTEGDIEELVSLWKKKHEYLLQKPDRIRKLFEIEARPRIIVAGTRKEQRP